MSFWTAYYSALMMFRGVTPEYVNKKSRHVIYERARAKRCRTKMEEFEMWYRLKCEYNNPACATIVPSYWTECLPEIQLSQVADEYSVTEFWPDGNCIRLK